MAGSLFPFFLGLDRKHGVMAMLLGLVLLDGLDLPLDCR